MKNKQVQFTVNALPCNVNNAVRMTSRGGYKTKHYKLWENAVNMLPTAKIVDATWYEIELVLHFPIYNKNGTVKRKDASNYIKYAEDLFFKKLTTYDGNPIDDSRILQGSYQKVDSKKLYTEFTVYAL